MTRLTTQGPMAIRTMEAMNKMLRLIFVSTMLISSAVFCLVFDMDSSK